MDVQAWTSVACEMISEVGDGNKVTVVRALGSQELTIDDGGTYTSLDVLARGIATTLGGPYLPGLLQKTRQVQPLKLLSRVDRGLELQNVYTCLPAAEYTSEVLIVDDILTTGTTIQAIGKAILDINAQAKITAFTLAYADLYTRSDDPSLSSFSYQWQSIRGWVARDHDEMYAALMPLVKSIRNDEW